MQFCINKIFVYNQYVDETLRHRVLHRAHMKTIVT
jgi:hypothetical protein